jgi:Uma2 family endonuclease
MTPTATPTTTAPPMRHYLAQSTFRRFTLDEYHKLIEIGVLVDGEPYELLEGHLVLKMSRGTPHDSIILVLTKRFVRLAPMGWEPRVRSAITLTNNSEPEPDFALVRGDETTFRKRHPNPADIGLVAEVSDSSLAIDRHDKGSIYAANGIPVYWVVNVPEKLVEVYTQPSGTGDAATYAHRQDYVPGSAVPVTLDGVQVGTVSVNDIFG